jgi:hypothetical protein
MTENDDERGTDVSGTGRAVQLGADAEIFRMYGSSHSDLRPMTEEAVGRLLIITTIMPGSWRRIP